ncbi:unnamed protein product [Phytophthora fragariaefolia]|uniref:Unnamed protein product n=1 Tax=Phytophthora fragariaefolia TaxID=1490495 RepID=A0A9W6XDK6_9STRA|nr:unnamed protein product [Phytophthora fragariaefolia]
MATYGGDVQERSERFSVRGGRAAAGGVLEHEFAVFHGGGGLGEVFGHEEGVRAEGALAHGAAGRSQDRGAVCGGDARVLHEAQRGYTHGLDGRVVCVHESQGLAALLGVAAHWHGLVAAQAAPLAEGQVGAVARAGAAGGEQHGPDLGGEDGSWHSSMGELARAAAVRRCGLLRCGAGAHRVVHPRATCGCCDGRQGVRQPPEAHAIPIILLVGDLLHLRDSTALAFFTTTGYRFRPLPVNPYLEVPMHEDDLEEFALDDDEDDLDFHSVQRADIRKFAYGAPVKTKASYSIKSKTGNSPAERASYAKKRSGSFNSDL